MVNKPIDTKTTRQESHPFDRRGKILERILWNDREAVRTGLLVNVRGGNNAPPVLQIGFDIDGTEPDNVTYTLGGRLTFLDVGLRLGMAYGFCDWKYLWDFFRVIQKISSNL